MVTVTGTNGSVVRTKTFSLLIRAFTLSAAPTSRTITKGSSTTYMVTLALVDGFTGTVPFWGKTLIGREAGKLGGTKSGELRKGASPSVNRKKARRNQEGEGPVLERSGKPLTIVCGRSPPDWMNEEVDNATPPAVSGVRLAASQHIQLVVVLVELHLHRVPNLPPIQLQPLPLMLVLCWPTPRADQPST